MSQLLAEFERRCTDAAVDPKAALEKGGVHKTLWKKWKAGKVSPTLKSFEAANQGLTELVAERAAA